MTPSSAALSTTRATEMLLKWYALLPDEMRVGHDFQEAHAQAFLHLLVVLRDEVRAAALGIDVQMAPVGVLDEQAAGADEFAD